VFNTKKGAATLLLIVTIGLILIKAAASWITGSISILAQALDSMLDVFAGVVTYSTIRFAEKPADNDHPYGHGKAEDLGGLIQAMLLFGAGSLIVYSAVKRIIDGTPVETPETGIGVMFVSVVASVFLSRHLTRVSKATGSVVLQANARNIAGDVYSALAVFAGLFVVGLTGLSYIDAILAIAVSLYVFITGYRTLYESLSGLLDKRLPASHEEIIRKIIDSHRADTAGYHKLMTRHIGSRHQVDVHILMNYGMTLEQSHKIADNIEHEIERQLPDTMVTIHVEPCNRKCDDCGAICKLS
jgi:cation diffusion facilitator family transporter